jgi:ankyrin repeat protein
VFNNERGYDQNSKETSLHIAASEGNFEMVKLLVNAGADVNILHRHFEHEQNPLWEETGSFKGEMPTPLQLCVCALYISIYLSPHSFLLYVSSSLIFEIVICIKYLIIRR